MISNEIKELINTIDESLNSSIYLKGQYQQKVYESIKYSLFTGGKRLRPIFAIKSFELFNDDIQQILPFASAIEMIHTYSLIHDDLPSMDDDKIRRGNPTNHIVYGEALAILAGDGLLNLAYETMLKSTIKSAKSLEDYEKRVRIMQIIASASGIEGMIGGQVVDLLGNEDDMDEDKLNFMYKAKTSALFEASMLAGSMLGGASDREIEIMHSFSKKVGMAYQIKDDFLDIEQDEEIEKYTYLSLKDNKLAFEKLEDLTKGALEDLKNLEDRNTEFLMKLTVLLLNREK
nr:polyprenyl synthetase family protein [Tissierella sp.]